MENKINWENVSLIAKLKKGDEFYFKHRGQSKIKGRKFVFIGLVGKICYYSEVGKEKLLVTDWKRDIIKK